MDREMGGDALNTMERVEILVKRDLENGRATLTIAENAR